MKRISKYILLALAAVTLGSCSNWLDVEPETTVRENDLFKNYEGYKNALSGCYMALASQNLYGENLTLKYVDVMARIWTAPSGNMTNEPYIRMYNHDYANSYAKTIIDNAFTGWYNVIVQDNMIIKHAATTKVMTEQQRNVILGEAYAMRAFCHLDVLRFFGQMPQNAQKQVSLPYAETTTVEELPKYYDYNGYVAKLKADFDTADSLLSLSDPAMDNSLYKTSTDDADITDDYMTYRRMRFNVWAVRALKARMYLYIGDKQNAYRYAKDVISATPGGEPVCNLAGRNDLTAHKDNNSNYNTFYYALPTECLLSLSVPSLIDYSIKDLGGDPSVQVNTSDGFFLSQQMLDQQLYFGKNIAADNRYLYQWEKNTVDNTGQHRITLKKYYYNSNVSYDLSILRFYLQIVPIIRLSEVYLIAIETTTSLAEANSLYKTYMESHNVNIATDQFASLDDVQSEILDEYRREFYGEGQMFYTYKRLGIQKPMFSATDFSEDDYILPKPDAEFDANSTTK